MVMMVGRADGGSGSRCDGGKVKWEKFFFFFLEFFFRVTP